MPNYVRDHCLHKRHTSHARICTRFTHLHAVFRAITKRINCADDIQNQYARVVAKLQSLDVRSRHKYIKYATIYEVAEKNHPDMTSDSMHTKCIHGRREETRIRMRPRTNTKRVSLTYTLQAPRDWFDEVSLYILGIADYIYRYTITFCANSYVTACETKRTARETIKLIELLSLGYCSLRVGAYLTVDRV